MMFVFEQRYSPVEPFQMNSRGASGKYFDNDTGRFATPHPDALDNRKCEEIAHIIETILNNKLKVSDI